jgi:hypothetical protein
MKLGIIHLFPRGQPPGSARPAAHIMKISRLAVAVRTVAAGPAHPR